MILHGNVKVNYSISI